MKPESLMKEPEETVFTGEDLLQWRVAHGVVPRFEANALVFADTRNWEWHLLRLERPEFLFRKLRLLLVVRPLPGQDANIYVHHFGNLDVAEIAPDGTIVNRGISLSIDVKRLADGNLAIETTFLNRHPSISVGSARQGGIYAGSGCDQFALLRIEVGIHDAGPLLHAVPEEERLRLIDVGGAGGIQLHWMLQADRITPILFEPNPAEASKLHDVVGRVPGGRVIESGLAHIEGPQKLHIAANAGCTSLLQPNFGLLSRYSAAPAFKIQQVVDVSCTRYDALYHRGLVPAPDVIKIDVQGYEWEVLMGFGALLQTCLGIELEAHFYPLYHGQKLLHELVRLLEEFGLVFRKLQPVGHCDGDLIEVDAFFTRRCDAFKVLGAVERRKFALLTHVWGLPTYASSWGFSR